MKNEEKCYKFNKKQNKIIFYVDVIIDLKKNEEKLIKW